MLLQSSKAITAQAKDGISYSTDTQSVLKVQKHVRPKARMPKLCFQIVPTDNTYASLPYNDRQIWAIYSTQHLMKFREHRGNRHCREQILDTEPFSEMCSAALHTPTKFREQRGGNAVTQKVLKNVSSALQARTRSRQRRGGNSKLWTTLCL